MPADVGWGDEQFEDQALLMCFIPKSISWEYTGWITLQSSSGSWFAPGYEMRT